MTTRTVPSEPTEEMVEAAGYAFMAAEGDVVESLRAALKAAFAAAPELDEMALRKILSEEVKERGGPQDYLDMLANKWMEIDSELPPELSAALAAMKRVARTTPIPKVQE